jgi:hypothetical protein
MKIIMVSYTNLKYTKGNNIDIVTMSFQSSSQALVSGIPAGTSWSAGSGTKRWTVGDM